MLEIFETDLVDQIIVTEKNYYSMMANEKNIKNNNQEELEHG